MSEYTAQYVVIKRIRHLSASDTTLYIREINFLKISFLLLTTLYYVKDDNNLRFCRVAYYVMRRHLEDIFIVRHRQK